MNKPIPITPSLAFGAMALIGHWFDTGPAGLHVGFVFASGFYFGMFIEAADKRLADAREENQ